MAKVISDLGDIFDYKAKSGKSKKHLSKGDVSGNSRAALLRVAQKAPEVMVKVSGATKGARHLKSHMDYITRNGKIEAENEMGEVINNREDLRAIHKEWLSDGSKRYKNTRESVNLVLSMPKGTDRDAVLNASRKFAIDNFSTNHQYLLVEHRDTDHPHCHLAVKALGFDGQRLDPRKAQLQNWREQFAGNLREQGVVAEATPRFVRGVKKKSLRQPVHHLKDRKASKVIRNQITEALSSINSKSGNTRPWEKAIAERNKDVKQKWGRIAKLSSDHGDIIMERSVQKLMESMEKQETRKQEYQRIGKEFAGQTLKQERDDRDKGR